MSRLPILSGREVVKILNKVGYYQIRQRSSHIRLACSNRKTITVPDYKTIGRGLLRKILRDAELSIVEFNKIIHQ